MHANDISACQTMVSLTLVLNMANPIVWTQMCCCFMAYACRKVQIDVGHAQSNHTYCSNMVRGVQQNKLLPVLFFHHYFLIYIEGTCRGGHVHVQLWDTFNFVCWQVCVFFFHFLFLHKMKINCENVVNIFFVHCFWAICNQCVLHVFWPHMCIQTNVCVYSNV